MWLLIYMIVLIENDANMIMKVYLGTNNELYSEAMSLGLKINLTISVKI